MLSKISAHVRQRLLQTLPMLDGGHLLYTIKDWKRPSTYNDLAEIYVKYIVTKFGRTSVVVFDGYNGLPNTKAGEQRCRARIGSSPSIEVWGNLPVTT